MPSVALSLIFMLVATKLGVPASSATVGIFIVMVVVGVIKYIPFASRTSLNAMLQLSAEIEEAGLIMHIPWWKRMTHIIFPIQKAAIISGFLFIFSLFLLHNFALNPPFYIINYKLSLRGFI
jgi:iron(III) transport system permease protein